MDTCPTFSELAQECAEEGSGSYEKWRSDHDIVCGMPSLVYHCVLLLLSLLKCMYQNVKWSKRRCK